MIAMRCMVLLCAASSLMSMVATDQACDADELHGSSLLQAVKTRGADEKKDVPQPPHCVDQVFEDKCKGCMCSEGSSSWCNTACDPTGEGDQRSNSCCQPFKESGDICGADWECGDWPYGQCAPKRDLQLRCYLRFPKE